MGNVINADFSKKNQLDLEKLNTPEAFTKFTDRIMQRLTDCTPDGTATMVRMGKVEVVVSVLPESFDENVKLANEGDARITYPSVTAWLSTMVLNDPTMAPDYTLFILRLIGTAGCICEESLVLHNQIDNCLDQILKGANGGSVLVQYRLV